MPKMPRLYFATILILCGAAAVSGTASPSLAAPSDHVAMNSDFAARGFDGDLDVLTYNVHGLPWVIAGDRRASLIAIGHKLHDLHRQGRAPEVVVVQEAFTGTARQLGSMAGYRYAAMGPGPKDRAAMSTPHSPAVERLEANAHWWKGEGIGKFYGSGLMILSDYPITSLQSMTYSANACAGFDCLASKGAMIAEVTLPGDRVVEIATTHMNSRHASGVSNARSTSAWQVQSEQLQRFLATHRNPGLPLVLGGDFNVGYSLPRQSAMRQMMARLGSATYDGLRRLSREGASLSPDASYELKRGRDWELVAAGRQTLTARSVDVPFGTQGGKPLSDHLGYAVHYVFG